MLNPRQLIDIYLFGRHRLETVKLLPLGCSVNDAVASYGKPLESGSLAETTEITQYEFAAGPYHQVVALEWKQTIQSITYWSLKSVPARDLHYMLEGYKNGGQWQVMEEGYWYQRDDGKVRLWCSAVPAIGVAYVEFLVAKAKHDAANALKKLTELPDVTWVPDEAVFEMQRRFIEDQNRGLMEFASRSDKIAASPDGRHVFVVRNHQAYDVEDGFMELNAPPEHESACSTQVINYFIWSEDGSVWGKSVLPRNAKVDFIRFDGTQCHLQIRHTATNRVLTFTGSAASILPLAGGSLGPYDDDQLWQGLEAAARLARSNGLPPADRS